MAALKRASGSGSECGGWVAALKRASGGDGWIVIAAGFDAGSNRGDGADQICKSLPTTLATPPIEKMVKRKKQTNERPGLASNGH